MLSHSDYMRAGRGYIVDVEDTGYRGRNWTLHWSEMGVQHEDGTYPFVSVRHSMTGARGIVYPLDVRVANLIAHEGCPS